MGNDLFTDEQLLEQISYKFRCDAFIGARVKASHGIGTAAGTIVGANNDFQVRVCLDGRQLVYSFTPSQLRFYDTKGRINGKR